MTDNYIELLRKSFDEYLDYISEHQFEPTEIYLGYDFSFLNDRKWHLMGEMMVEGELRELTNNLNHWRSSLHRWQAWNLVTAKLSADQAWILRRELLESLAHECLLRPSAIRDTFTSVATNALHQIRLSDRSTYRDVLVGDPTKPGERPKHLSRKKKEHQLSSIAAIWPNANSLLSLIRRLDDETYRQSTSDYRNLNSHTIGPRLGVGETRVVKRSVIQATYLKDIGNKLFEEAQIPGKLSVSYSFGGTPQLDLSDVRLLNLEQFKIARNCYLEYRTLLESLCSSIPSTNADV